MDLQSRLQKKKQQAALRARRLNKAANRLLQSEITVLESNFKKQEKQTYRKTKSIERELYSDNTDNIPVQRKESVPKLDLSELKDELQSPSQKSDPSGSCMYHPKSSRCSLFPCRPLSTYHSLGYNLRAPTGKTAQQVTSKTYLFHDGVAIETREVLAAKESQSVRKNTSPRISIQDRQRGLQQLVKEMKERVSSQRPRDWAINYGDPVSCRLLVKPVIPISDVES